jgi:excisionase family DNA binding protein
MAVNDVTMEGSDARRRSAESWRADSVCRKHPTRWWFGGDHRETVLAKGICAGCAVQAPCLEFALGRPELLGVWAATTPSERAAMRRTGSVPAFGTAADAEVDAPVDTPVEVPVEIPVEAAAEAEVDIDIDLVLEGEHDREPERAPEPEARPRRGSPRSSGIADADELLTPAEAAHRLGVTANTVTRWSRAGRLAAVHTVGGHRRFRCSEVERVLLAANAGAAVSATSL